MLRRRLGAYAGANERCDVVQHLAGKTTGNAHFLDFVRGFLRDAGFHLTTRDEDPRYYVPYHVHGSR